MIFCEKCFKDHEIANTIRNLAVDNKGQCRVCGRSDVYLYDTDVQKELTGYFEDWLGIYSSEDELPENFPKFQKRSLLDDISYRWDIFNVSRENAYHILLAVCKNSLINIEKLLSRPVGIEKLYDREYISQHGLLKNDSWEDFVAEIKTVNRYHSRRINMDVLAQFCSYVRKRYSKGQIFYRARISDKNGYPIEAMSAPPAHKSTEGRANTKGIRCLYLADAIDTTIHEVRAGSFDYIPIGTFELQKDITVVNLRAINDISPFTYGLGHLDYAINKTYLEKLNYEMSKTLRRSDSTLDYIPTQYIVDFIKSIKYHEEQEYAGVEYKSTTYPSGYNLAIFNPDVFKCVEAEVYEISDLSYKYSRLKSE